MNRSTQWGMTLIEILTVLAIVGFLAVFIISTLTDSTAQSRDAERQADINLLKTAIELYRQENGRYPEACNGPNNWSGEAGSAYACSSGNQYITDLAPKYIRTLPTDPRTNGNESGYVYKVNNDGTVFKLVVFQTVEQLRVTNDSGTIVPEMQPLLFCDMYGATDEQATCLSTNASINPSWGGSMPNHCNPAHPIEGVKFQSSYAVWGGYAQSGNAVQQEGRTENVICDAPPTS